MRHFSKKLTLLTIKRHILIFLKKKHILMNNYFYIHIFGQKLTSDAVSFIQNIFFIKRSVRDKAREKAWGL